MTFAEFLIMLAVSVGFTIGTWWSRNRRGGIADLREQRNNALREAQRLRQRLHATAAGHPSSQQPRTDLRLVTGDQA